MRGDVGLFGLPFNVVCGVSCLGATVGAGAGIGVPSQQWEGDGDPLAVDVEGTAGYANGSMLGRGGSAAEVEGTAWYLNGSMLGRDGGAAEVEGTARHSTGSLLGGVIDETAATDSPLGGLCKVWELAAERLDGLSPMFSHEQ